MSEKSMQQRQQRQQQQQQQFLSLENLKECERRLHTYIDQQNVAISIGSDLELRRKIYEVMQQVDASADTGDMSLRAKNNQTLNHVLAVATKPQGQGQGQPQPQPQGHVRGGRNGGGGGDATSSVLLRDQEFYGKRPVITPDSSLMPHRADTELKSTASEHILQSYDEAMNERNSLAGGGSPIPKINDPVMVDTLTSDDFSRRLKLLESERTSTVQPLQEPQAAAALRSVMERSSGALDRPGALDRSSGALDRPGALDDPPTPTTFLPLEMNAGRAGEQERRAVVVHGREPQLVSSSGSGSGSGSGGSGSYDPSSHQQVTDTRYLTISAADRDISAQPERFRFTARSSGNQDTASLLKSYHDVAWIEATHIVLPMEIMQATGSVVGPKGYYRMEFSFAFQYVTLRIDGFDNTYDGTNDAVRRAFAVFIYESDYKAPNGRGYVVLKPSQGERHDFQSAPLSTLRDLTLSILKPNGTLFNGSRDDFTVSHVQYETMNRLFLKLVVNQYFDRNEFYVGDYVSIQGFKLSRRDGTISQEYVAALEAYLNRSQGHEIVQMGATNDSGFVNMLYILAPGVMDVSQGRVLVDDNIVSVVGALGGGPSDAGAAVYASSSGTIVNVSLQPIVTLRVGCERNLLSRKPQILPPLDGTM